MDVKQRFSNRAEDYLLYRPSYPEKLLGFIVKKFKIKASSVIVDIGSGTGKLTHPFVSQGYLVKGVEPNDEMRKAAENLFSDYPNFQSINGSAEDTTLNSGSCYLILAGQAFHWFEPTAARKEFQRILQPGGWVALIWNNRENQTEFNEAYEAFVNKYSTDYQKVNHQNIGEEEIASFFAPSEVETKSFANKQLFNSEQLLGRYLSSSYALTREDTQFPEAKAALEELFQQFQDDGQVKMTYNTTVYYSKFPVFD